MQQGRLIPYEAIDKVKDPEFRENVKNTAVNAATTVKEATVNTYHKVKDPEFQQQARENINSGVNRVHTLVVGPQAGATTDEELHPLTPNHQAPQPDNEL